MHGFPKSMADFARIHGFASQASTFFAPFCSFMFKVVRFKKSIMGLTQASNFKTFCPAIPTQSVFLARRSNSKAQ